jgi:hypothetical protein
MSSKYSVGGNLVGEIFGEVIASPDRLEKECETFPARPDRDLVRFFALWFT